MAPSITSAKLTLSYPLYAADFDPSNSNFLVVGGGGGEGRSGVGNKIVRVCREYPGVIFRLTVFIALDLGRYIPKAQDFRGRRR